MRPASMRTMASWSGGPPVPSMSVQPAARRGSRRPAAASYPVHQKIDKNSTPNGSPKSRRSCFVDRRWIRPSPTVARTIWSCACTPMRASSAWARLTRRRKWSKRSSTRPASHAIASGLRHVLVGQDPLDVERVVAGDVSRVDLLRPPRRGAARDQRHRHRAVGYQGEGRWANRSRELIGTPQADACPRVRVDADARHRAEDGAQGRAA